MIASTRRRALGATFLVAAATGLTACSGNGLESAMDDPLEGVMGGDPMVALGLRADPNAEEIEYNPRSPLVMPRDASQLPAPQQAAEGYGENWPDDPDARARRELREARLAAAAEGVEDMDRAAEALSPDELNEWSKRSGLRGRHQAGDYTRAEGQERSKVVDPRELLDRKSDPTQLSRAEPVRGDLTEPPPGYRTPAVNADGTVAMSDEPPEKKGFFSKLFGL